MAIEYRLISCSDAYALTQEVNKALREGWQLQGGASIAVWNGNAGQPDGRLNWLGSQAVIRSRVPGISGPDL